MLQTLHGDVRLKLGLHVAIKDQKREDVVYKLYYKAALEMLPERRLRVTRPELPVVLDIRSVYNIGGN